MPGYLTPRLPDTEPRPAGQASPPVRFVLGLESAPALDAVAAVLERLSAPLGHEPVRSILLGKGTGHALHPFLTDLPIGFWTSSWVLDLCGGRSARRASASLLAWGVVSAVPTALTGLAEWREAPRPESRVGVVHAALNLVALGGFALSWRQRRQGRYAAGVGTSLFAGTVASAAGFLGGHLATARKVGTRDPAYLADGVGPRLTRPTSERPVEG
jgi:uncharacterized membrane protein